jgi:hypothetical protein
MGSFLVNKQRLGGKNRHYYRPISASFASSCTWDRRSGGEVLTIGPIRRPVGRPFRVAARSVS